MQALVGVLVTEFTDATSNKTPLMAM